MKFLDLIKSRREAQIAKGYDAQHDDYHLSGEIARGAAAILQCNRMEWPWRSDALGSWRINCPFYFSLRPPSVSDVEARILDIADAAAMLLAEGERLQRSIGIDTEEPRGLEELLNMTTPEAMELMRRCNADTQSIRLHNRDGQLIAGVIFLHGRNATQTVFEAFDALSQEHSTGEITEAKPNPATLPPKYHAMRADEDGDNIDRLTPEEL